MPAVSVSAASLEKQGCEEFEKPFVVQQRPRSLGRLSCSDGGRQQRTDGKCHGEDDDEARWVASTEAIVMHVRVSWPLSVFRELTACSVNCLGLAGTWKSQMVIAKVPWDIFAASVRSEVTQFMTGSGTIRDRYPSRTLCLHCRYLEALL